jgi:hypothetical protein
MKVNSYRTNRGKALNSAKDSCYVTRRTGHTSEIHPIVLTVGLKLAITPLKYATIIVETPRNCKSVANSYMLLIALVVRSTTQKDKAFEYPQGDIHTTCALPPGGHYLLHGTDKQIIVAIEGIVAHGPGGNKGKILVL